MQPVRALQEAARAARQALVLLLVRPGDRELQKVKPLLLTAVSVVVLYGLWLLLKFVFTMIEVRHALLREERSGAADPRTLGGERSRRADA